MIKGEEFEIYISLSVDIILLRMYHHRIWMNSNSSDSSHNIYTATICSDTGHQAAGGTSSLELLSCYQALPWTRDAETKIFLQRNTQYLFHIFVKWISNTS